MSYETDIQFLARMLVAVREGGQISSADAQHLGNLAQFGPGPQPTTMPEERRLGSQMLASERVEG